MVHMYHCHACENPEQRGELNMHLGRSSRPIILLYQRRMIKDSSETEGESEPACEAAVSKTKARLRNRLDSLISI